MAFSNAKNGGTYWRPGSQDSPRTYSWEISRTLPGSTGGPDKAAEALEDHPLRGGNGKVQMVASLGRWDERDGR